MSTSNGLSGLFGTAVQDGVLSKAALNAINVGDIGADINAALGVSVDDVTASEVVLLTVLLDDSSSINGIRKDPLDMQSPVVGPELIRDGHNLLVDALTKSKQGDGILASCSYLNRGLLYPYGTISKVPRLDATNYRASGSTPLYDQSIVTLGTVIAKTQEFLDNGIACRTVTPIITDGADYGSRKKAADVAKIVNDMLKSEMHIIAGIGIDDGSTDFNQVFSEMGIRPEWILTPKNSPSEIRRAFAILSQSAQRASQSSATFSQSAMGGFASP